MKGAGVTRNYSLHVCLLTLILSVGVSLTTTQEPHTNNAVGSCGYRRWGRPGTLKLLVVAGVHEHDGSKCGPVSTSTFPHLVALDWILDFLNNTNSFIPGHSIGFDVIDNCDDVDYTTDILLDEGVVSASQTCDQNTKTDTSQSAYIGALSLTDVTSTLKMADLFGPAQVIMRPLPSAPAFSTHRHPNLLQTLPSPEQEIQFLTKALQKFKWNFVALIYTNDEEGRSASTLFKQSALSAGICVNFEYQLSGNGDTKTAIEDTSFQIIKHLEIDLINASNNSLGVVYLGTRKPAIILLDVMEQRLAQHGDVAALRWLFPSSVGLSSKVINIIRRIQTSSSSYFAASITTPDIDQQQFRDHFYKVLNKEIVSTPFGDLIDDYITTALGCNITGAMCKTRAMKLQERSLSSVLDAVYSMVDAVRVIVQDRCPPSCSLTDLQNIFSLELKTKIQSRGLSYDAINASNLPGSLSVSNRSLTWTDNGHAEIAPHFISFQISSLTSDHFRMIAIYSDDNEVTVLQSNIPSSTCKHPSATVPDFCPICKSRFHVRFSYLPGDAIILGLFSIRLGGDTPYECGDVREGTLDVITVSAFLESVRSLRQATNISFGGLAIDDCYSPFNTSSFLTDLFSERVILRDPATGTPINMGSVCTIVGALSSPVTLVVADQAMALGIPMISYSASSPEMDNRNRYPYFLRTVPSDTLQVRGMVELIQKMGVSHVGAMHIDDPYGKTGISLFQQRAENVGICMEESLPVSQDSTDDELREVVESLYKTQSRVVVHFSIDNVALRLLEILSKESVNKDPITFIASEAWGTNPKLIAGTNGKVSKGSIVFNIDIRKSLNSDFSRFLATFNSSNINRWAPLYWEDKLSCSYVTSFEKRNEAKCDPSKETMSEEERETLNNDQRSVHVIQAVMAAGQGFLKAKPSECRPTACVTYLRSRPDILTTAIREITLTSSAVPPFRPFKDDGSGNIGFTLLNIQRSGSSFAYTEIGKYDNHSGLVLHSPPMFYDKFGNEKEELRDHVDTVCANFLNCKTICRTPVESTTPGQNSTTSAPISSEPQPLNQTLLTTTVLFGSILGVVVVALIIFIVVFLRRQPSTKALANDPSFTASVASHLNRSMGNIYDEPGHVHSGGRLNDGFSDQISPTSSRRHKSSFEDDHVQYSPIAMIANARSSPRSRTSIPSSSPAFRKSPNIALRNKVNVRHERQRSQPEASRDMLSDEPITRTLPRDKHEHRRHEQPPPVRHAQPAKSRFRFPSASNYDEVNHDVEVFHDQEDNHNESDQHVINYITPNSSQAGNINNNADKEITYLSANDLDLSNDEEDEEVAETSPVSYVDMQMRKDSSYSDNITADDKDNASAHVQAEKQSVTYKSGVNETTAFDKNADKTMSRDRLSQEPDVIPQRLHPIIPEEHFFV